MKTLILFAALIFSSTSFAQNTRIDTKLTSIKLPELNKIKKTILEGSYNCDDSKRFGLDLIESDMVASNQEVFLNHSCGSTMSFESGLVGGGLDLIAEIGTVNIEDLNLLQGLAPKWEVGQSFNFRLSADVKEGHSYSVIINNWRATGLMLLRVDKIEGAKVYISYVVKKYTLITHSRDSSDSSYNTIQKN